MGMKKSGEGCILKGCLEYLKLRGIWAWRVNSGAMGGTYKGKKWFLKFHSISGVADILGVAGGRFLAVECKQPGKKPTADQQTFLDRVRLEGGIALCVHSVQELVDALARQADL